MFATPSTSAATKNMSAAKNLSIAQPKFDPVTPSAAGDKETEQQSSAKRGSQKGEFSRRQKPEFFADSYKEPEDIGPGAYDYEAALDA